MDFSRNLHFRTVTPITNCLRRICKFYIFISMVFTKTAALDFEFSNRKARSCMVFKQRHFEAVFENVCRYRTKTTRLHLVTEVLKSFSACWSVT